MPEKNFGERKKVSSFDEEEDVAADDDVVTFVDVEPPECSDFGRGRAAGVGLWARELGCGEKDLRGLGVVSGS